MSLILEALRRSEAERQLGRVPNVLAPMPLPRVARRARRWPWWLALVLTLAALLAWVGWRHAEHTAPPVVSTSPVLVAIPHAAVESAASVAQHPRAMPANAAMNRATAGLPGPIQQGRIDGSGSAAKLPSPPPVATSAAAGTPAAGVITPPIDPAFHSEAGHDASAASAADTAPANADALQSIADLSPAERQALPTLKVSMHVYAEQAGDRFMIVDGARVGEGARIGDRIVLVRIRRDGGVLDIGGRRLLLPKP